MRVLHIVPSLSLASGGPTASVTNLCEGLNRIGVHAEIATVDSGDHLDWQGLTTVHTFPLHNPVRLRRSPALLEFLTEHGKEFDIIHVHGLWQWPCWYGRRIAQQHGIPLVISPRGMVEPWSLRQGVIQKWIAWWLWEKRNLRSASLFHATSHQEANSIVQLGLQQTICIVPNGLECPRPPASRPLEKVQRRLLFLSRLHPKKGVEQLLSSWAALQSRYLDWELILAGPGEPLYGTQLVSYARELGLERVEFVGAKYGDQKWELIRSADLFVLPSYSENFGNVVLESLSQGVPVIATQGTPWECLTQESCGWWVPLDQLTLALEQGMSMTPTQLHEMGNKGRTLAMRFNPEAVAEQMRVYYADLIQSRSAT